MKLPDGMTIHTGGRVYRGEIPENRIPAKLPKTKINKLLKAQEKPVKAD